MRLRVLRFVAGVAVLLVAILCWRLLATSGEVRSVLLKDGTKLRVAHMSYGKEHNFVPGPAWRRMLTKTPTNIAKLFGVVPRRDRYTDDTLVVWLEWHNPTNRLLYPQRLRVLDSNGLAAPYIYIGSLVTLSNNTTWAKFLLTSFPRRQAFLDFEWFGCSPTNGMLQEEQASFRVKNPWHVAKPTSPLPPWPSSAEFHGEQFTLLAINSGLAATGSMAFSNVSNQWTECVFRIGTNEPAQLSTNPLVHGKWAVKSLELRDAFGNLLQDREPHGRIFPMEQRYMIRKDDGIGLLKGAAWPDQTWNVRAEFQTGHFDPDDTHTWTATVTVPAPGETIELKQTGQIEACTLELTSIERGPRSASFPSGPPPILVVKWRENSQILPKSVVPKSYDLRLVRAADQRGSNVVYWFRGANKGTVRYDLRVAPESKELKVTFAVQHSIFVELSGHSSILRSNVARWAK